MAFRGDVPKPLMKLNTKLFTSVNKLKDIRESNTFTHVCSNHYKLLTKLM